MNSGADVYQALQSLEKKSFQVPEHLRSLLQDTLLSQSDKYILNKVQNEENISVMEIYLSIISEFKAQTWLCHSYLECLYILCLCYLES